MPSHEGILRVSGSLKPDEKIVEKTTGVFCLVILPGHPEWEATSAKTSSAGRLREGVDFKFMFDPIVWLVNSMPDSPNASSDLKDGRFGILEVDELKINGLDVWAELQRLKEELRALKEASEGEAAAGGAGSGTGGGSGIGGEPRLESCRADLAEHMQKLHCDEVRSTLRCGPPHVSRPGRRGRPRSSRPRARR